MTELALPNVMLCAVTGFAIPETVRALTLSRRGISFGDTALLVDKPQLASVPTGIRVVAVPPLMSREAYSGFMINDLARYVSREHVLVVQWDGFITTPAAWRDEFLDYDYIGAPWPQFAPPGNVGNGGFSLRSRKLLNALADGPFAPRHPEDVAICRDWRPMLEADFGIRFAPANVARHFSFERSHPEGPVFGFHGLFNLPDVVPVKDLDGWLCAMPGALLASRDASDLVLRLARYGKITQATGLLSKQVRALGLRKALLSAGRQLPLAFCQGLLRSAKARA